MKEEIMTEFVYFCNNAGIYLYRNSKLDVSSEKLVGTAGIVLKIKKGRIRCKINFGKDVTEDIVTGLFENLPYLKELYALELVNVPFIPVQIGKLHDLQSLEIDSRYIVNLPNEIKYLCCLTELSLRIDNLKEIPDWIVDLKKLEILDLLGTQIDQIPSNINKLSNLKVLDLCCTHLKKIPRTILDLNLPFKDYFNEDDAPGVYLCDSTCENPSTDIILGGRRRLEIYYNSNETVSQNEVRVILLGLKGCGKTSMVQRIMELEDGKTHYKESNSWTEGIAINDIKCENKGILHIWDFGGQEIMLSTHTLFLRDYCIYVIVLNARQGDDPERWLDFISQYGRNSSVFIVNNHMDEADVSQVDINKLRRLYPDLKINNNKIWEISCKKPDEFPLKEFYEQLLLVAANFFSKKITLSWKLLNSNLGDMKKLGKSVNYITHDEYLAICEKCGINNAYEKEEALKWLNDIGTVFTYGNFLVIDKVNEYKVLKPIWVTDAIYKIINNVKLNEEFCLISHEEIRSALRLGKGENKTNNIYTNSEVGFILEVMRKFYLSFRATETCEFIPAVARNEEFEEVAKWIKDQDDTILDIIYSLSQNGKQKKQVSSVSLTYLYQVIINIVEDFKVFPRMWRAGALFQDLLGMQVLIFLQNKGKWNCEMRLMIKNINEEKDKIQAANFHQKILQYLDKFANSYIIDAKVLIRNNEEKHYFSITEASKIVLNRSDFIHYDSEIDKYIDLFEDVLKNVVSISEEQILVAIKRLRKEVREGNCQTDNAVHILNQIVSKISLIQIRMEDYNRMIQKLGNNEVRWLELYSQAIYNSNELKSQLQIILETCNLQEYEINVLKEWMSELSNKRCEKIGIVEIVKKGLTALSTGVTLATADYDKILHLFEILMGMVESLGI